MRRFFNFSGFSAGPLRIALIMLVIAIFIFIFLGQTPVSAQDDSMEAVYCQARIVSFTELTEEEIISAFGDPEIYRGAKAKLRINEGKYKGQEFESLHLVQLKIDSMGLKKGDNVITMLEIENNQVKSVNILEYDRRDYIWVLTGIFFISIIILGRMTGLRSLAGLMISVLVIAFYFIPTTVKGNSPVIAAVITCFIATVATFMCMGGFKKKYMAALFGTLGGVSVAAIFSYVFTYAMRLSGSMEHDIRILSLEMGDSFDFRGLLLAGIMIGALGAVMDVAVSIASAQSELCEAGSVDSVESLFKSGIVIGRDIMGTMTNTLVLAYVGGSLPLLMLITLQKTDYPFLKIVNFDLIATEILRSLCGSLGLVFTIPLTAGAAAFLMRKKKND